MEPAESPPAGFTLGCHSCHVTPRNDRRRAVFGLGNAVQERYVTLRLVGSL